MSVSIKTKTCPSVFRLVLKASEINCSALEQQKHGQQLARKSRLVESGKWKGSRDGPFGRKKERKCLNNREVVSRLIAAATAEPKKSLSSKKLLFGEFRIFNATKLAHFAFWSQNMI